jgi:hypothetical protein
VVIVRALVSLPERILADAVPHKFRNALLGGATEAFGQAVLGSGNTPKPPNIGERAKTRMVLL